MEDTQIKTVQMAELAREAGINHHTFLTRRTGRRFLPLLESIAQDLADWEAFVLDFDGVEIMDASFADEVFSTVALGRSRRIHRYGCIILHALEDASLENLDMALSSRTVREIGLRNCVFPVHNQGFGTKLIGKSEGHVQTSFEVLKQHTHLTARELAELLNLDIAAASTRLKVLFDLGLATRIEEREGQVKQFIYTWPL